MSPTPEIPEPQRTKYAYRLLRDAELALLLAYVVLMIWRPLEAHDDVWAHAAIGSWIWQHQAVPHETIYIWSDSIPWVYHSWLSQLVFYGVASLPHDCIAITAFTLLVGLAPFVLIGWFWTGRDWIWFGVPAIWIAKAMVVRIYPRPELFTALGLAILLVALGRFTGRLNWKWLVGFAVLFGTWANLHGAVILGLVFIGVSLVADVIQYGDWQRARGLAVLLLVAVAAIHLNPYGFGYWRAFEPLNSYTFENIQEWKPLWNVHLPDDVLVGAAWSGAAALLSWVVSRERQLSQLAWIVLGAALFLHANRNLSIFILVNTLVTALNARALDRDRLLHLLARGKRIRESTLTPLYVMLHVVFVFLLLEEAAVVVMELPPSMPMQRLHDGCFAFLHEHPLQGRVFNDMENSAYLHWCLREEMPLFIDTVNAYRDKSLRDYFTMIQGGRDAHLLIDEYNINVIILTVHRLRSVAHLAENLDQSPEWARVYASGDGVVWVRRKDFGPLIKKIGPVRETPFSTFEFTILVSKQ